MMNVDQLNLVQNVVGSSMIKFDILDEMFDKIKISESKIVFHIDMVAVLCRCYQGRLAELLDNATPSWNVMSFVISMMNVIAHYRKYCVFKLHKENAIVITMDVELSDYQKSIYPDYKWDRIPNYRVDDPIYGNMNKTIREAYKYVQSLCMYFDGIYCIDYDSGIDGLTISAILRNDERFSNSYHILFTRNLAATQLINKYTSILFNQRDKSSLITRDNCYQDGVLRTCSKAIRERYGSKLPISLIPYVCALGGCRHVLKPSEIVPNLGAAAKLVNEMLELGLINKSVSIKSFLTSLELYLYKKKEKKKPKKKKISAVDIDTAVEQPEEEIESFELPDNVYNDLLDRYRVFSVALSSMAASKNQIIKILRNCIDLYDQNYLEKMNDILSGLGNGNQLIEVTMLNIDRPDRIEYDGSW